MDFDQVYLPCLGLKKKKKKSNIINSQKQADLSNTLSLINAAQFPFYLHKGTFPWEIYVDFVKSELFTSMHDRAQNREEGRQSPSHK